MSGANALEDDEVVGVRDDSFHNYVALPRSEAFRIGSTGRSRRPSFSGCRPSASSGPEDRGGRRGGSGIGREVAIQLATRGAHVVVADQHVESAARCRWRPRACSSAEAVFAATVDLQSRDSITAALRDAVLQFGGVDVLVNTAATLPDRRPVRISLGPDARDQRLQQLRARAGGGADPEAQKPAGIDRVDEAPPTPWCRKPGASRTT